jgi:hypothetical protein
MQCNFASSIVAGRARSLRPQHSATRTAQRRHHCGRGRVRGRGSDHERRHVRLQCRQTGRRLHACATMQLPMLEAPWPHWCRNSPDHCPCRLVRDARDPRDSRCAASSQARREAWQTPRAIECVPLRPTPLALIAQALHASTSTSTIPIVIAVAEYIRCHMPLGTRTPWLEYRCVFACARHRVYAPTLSASGVYSCVVASRDLRACRPRIIFVGRCLRAKKRRWRSVTLALASHRALHSVQRLSTLFEAWLRRVAVERGCVGGEAAHVSRAATLMRARIAGLLHVTILRQCEQYALCLKVH